MQQQQAGVRSGVAGGAVVADSRATTAMEEQQTMDVFDELRARQSLSSVINDPSRGRGVFNATSAASMGDFFEKLGESLQDLSGREAEAERSAEAAVLARCDALLGPLPDFAEFKPYLDSLADIWEIYHRNHKVKPAKVKIQVPTSGISSPAQEQDQQAHNNAESSPEVNGDVTPAALEDADRPPTSDACDAHQAVPLEYFLGDFKLEQHRIFRQSLQTSVERQEELNGELTGYLDLIEVSLFEHIRRAQRDQLFDSLARLSEPLQEDLRSALGVVTNVRKGLRSVKTEQLRFGLNVGRLARRKRRVAEVLQRLDCLSHVQQSQQTIEVNLQGQDYVTALELLESTKGALHNNLRGLVCVKAGSNRLSNLGATFDRAVEADFVHQSTEAILVPVSEAATGEIELRHADGLRRLTWCLVRRELLRSAIGSTLREVLLAQLKKALKSRAKTLLEELCAAQGPQATPSAADEVIGEDGNPVGAGATTGAPTAGEAGGQSQQGVEVPQQVSVAEALATTGIATALATLPFEGFVSFVTGLMQDCVAIAERYCEYAVLIQDRARGLREEAGGGARASGSAGPGEASEACGELLRLFEVSMSSQLQKIGVLLQARHSGDQQLNPSMSEWQRLLKFTNESLDKIKNLQDSCKQRLRPREPCAVSDVRGGMRAILYTQTKSVIEDFHQQRMTQVKCVLGQERWERTDVPVPYRLLLEKLVGLLEQTEGDVPSEAGASDRFLRVEGVNYLVVPAVLTLVQVLTEYLQLCRDFESLGAEIVQRMVKLLRYFREETQLLVLGGQAVQRQTLKKISAANLALCSQCCGLVSQVLPRLQANLLGILNGSSQAGGGGALSRAVAALAEDITKVATEYATNRSDLLMKLSDLLRDRYESTARKWLSSPHPEAKVDPAFWTNGGATAPAVADGEAGAPADQLDLCPHDALEGLVQAVTLMYKVLLKNLNGDSVRRIFATAFEDIASKFEQRLQHELQSPSPPYEDKVGSTLGDRLVMDVAYLRDRLGGLKGIGAPSQRLLLDLLHHLRTYMPADDPLKAVHPEVLEVLQRTGRLEKLQ